MAAEPMVFEVYRDARVSRVRDRAVVLTAIGVDCVVRHEVGEWVLLVAEGDGERARLEIAGYEEGEERRLAERAAQPVVGPAPGELRGGLVFSFLLMGAYVLQRATPDEVVEGWVMDVERVRAGEWWRLVTALGVHGSFEHVFANGVIGGFLFAFLAREWRTWVALLMAVLCGVLGNGLNLVFHWAGDHRSIGASTSVFAVMGLLFAHGWVGAGGVGFRGKVRAWVLPFGGAAAMYSFFAGDPTHSLDFHRVDHTAHFGGWLAGAMAGIPIARRAQQNAEKRDKKSERKNC
jgi:membrane associated rhomboid family serine protease